jgi:hypothetical protein
MIQILSFIFISLTLNCAAFTSISTSSQSSSSISTSVQSISTSLNSISSISSSLGSISGSSSSEKEKEKAALYQKDVKDLTYLLVKSNQTVHFSDELQTIAFRHGYSDWKSLDSSFLGIGEGLKKGGILDAEFSHLIKSLSKSAHHRNLLKTGFQG